jgi:transcriptional regulator with XRE-family HTH domain
LLYWWTTVPARTTPPDVFANFGAALSLLRRRRGISQERLAELAGVHENTVKRVESGRQEGGTRTIGRLLGALEVELDELDVALRRVNQRPPRRPKTAVTEPPPKPPTSGQILAGLLGFETPVDAALERRLDELLGTLRQLADQLASDPNRRRQHRRAQPSKR